jgi:hypothetical protein
VGTINYANIPRNSGPASLIEDRERKEQMPCPSRLALFANNHSFCIVNLKRFQHARHQELGILGCSDPVSSLGSPLLAHSQLATLL